ncbi:hypothetical protein EBZ37_10115 [bacterium]|nr:hypothetical protein [bacterium]
MFAIRRTDQSEFTLLKGDVSPPKKVSLGPLYLVWENINDQSVRTEGDYGWPFQVDRMELVDFGARFPRLAPPSNASAQAKLGFAAFRIHCLKCHSLNGEGGKVGPELNFPKNVTEYWRPGLLKAWILNPASFRYGSAMPAISHALPNRAEVADHVLAYLQAMRGAKKAPSNAKSSD